MAIEDYAVNAFVSEQANYEVLKVAVTDLIDVIMDDEETNQMIKQITMVRGKRDNTWVVYAIMNDDKSFKYAIYIDSEGRTVADGF